MSKKVTFSTRIAIRSQRGRWWVVAECAGLPAQVAREMRGRGLRATVRDAQDGTKGVFVDADEGIR